MDAQPQTDLKAYADRLEHLCRAQAAEIGKLRGEVERLTGLLQGSGLDAHTFLRNVYSDPEASESARLKAAELALNVEKPRLAPQPPPLDLAAEEIEPLAVLVEKRRARQNALQGRDIEATASGAVRVLSHKPGGNGGNGSDDDSSD